MPFELLGRKIAKVGVVGSGQIGPDIALHFTKSFHRYGVPVIVHDISEKALDAGSQKMRKKIEKGVETGAFKPDEAKAMIENVRFTVQKSDLKGCDLVVEAATELPKIKRAIFKDLEELCPDTAIFASNSSHLEPEVIFAEAKKKSRCLCTHYFFPAERNQMLEVIPGKETAPEIADFLLKLYEALGKFPIKVASRYGYAIDPIFEGIFQAAALCVEEGLASTKQVDAIACKVLGLGVGPFTAMNLTGGNPITQEGLNLMNEKVMRWFESPKILDEQIKSGKPWDVPGRGEKAEYTDKQFENVRDSLLGAYFGLAAEVLQAGIVGAGDFEMGCEIALVVTPPLRLMNRVGIEKSLKLVEHYAAKHDGFVVAEVLKKQSGPWHIPLLRWDVREGVAVITIKRPRNLNALNKEVIAQMQTLLERAKSDNSVRAVVITGYGTKAFVSGADIEMLASQKTPEEAEATCLHFQKTLLFMENLGKPVVCALNGLAFGGGSELAQACIARVAKSGIKTLFAQPEPKLGIIAGSGGTQRLPRIIGFPAAWKMLRTGEPINSEKAKELGLADALVDSDVLEAGIRLALDIAGGKVKPREMPKGPVPVPELPEIDIGGLSRKIDEIMRRAILEGAKMKLEDGLQFEAKMFAECLKTKDMRIGMENFLKNGVKQPAQFVHE